MALGRVTVWVAGQVLTAAAQNTEFNNILNNPIALISPTTGAINFNLQAHTNLIPSALSGTSGSSGNVLTLTAGLVPIWSVGSAGTSNSQPAQGSRVKGLIGVISSQSGTFAADLFIFQTTANTNSFSVVATSSFGASIGTAGPAAAGRDVAGAFSSTEVHWYAITTGVGSTAPTATVSSQRPIAGPVMPTSYNSWCYLGASPYTSASTTVVADHRVRGSWSYFDAAQNTGVSSSNPTTETTLVLSSYLPSNAEAMKLNWGTGVTGGGGFTDPTHLRVVTGSDFFTLKMMGNTVGQLATVQLEVPNVGRQIIYQSASSSGGPPPISIDFVGWKNPIGSE